MSGELSNASRKLHHFIASLLQYLIYTLTIRGLNCTLQVR
jgi:hypothetical protein